MTGALQIMLDLQDDLQLVMPPLPNRSHSDDPQTLCEYFKDNVLSAVAELLEMLEETGWKPWTTSWHINVDAARAEWIDAWHFFMNLANVLGMSEERILAMYTAKHNINRQRQRVGYDGVSTKCPKCKRALDDPATQCTVTVTKSGTGCGGVCQQHGTWLPDNS